MSGSRDLPTGMYFTIEGNLDLSGDTRVQIHRFTGVSQIDRAEPARARTGVARS